MKNKNLLIAIASVIIGLGIGYVLADSSSGESSTDHLHDSQEASWTCSMHPQIMATEAGSCPICGMDLIKADSDGAMSNTQIKLSENAMQLADIQTYVVSSTDAENENGVIELSGSIEINSKNKLTQAAHIDARIEKIYINTLGERVVKNQKLASLYAPELIAAQQELLTASSLKEQQPELYNAVRTKLKNWKLSDVQIDAIESSQTLIETFTVYADVSGIVTKINAKTGDYVKKGQSLFEVSDLSTVWAVFDAYENQVGAFELGQNIEVKTQAFPRETFTARVSFIDPIFDQQSRTLEVRAEIRNTNGMLKPGMFAMAAIEGMTEDTATLKIPESSVLWTGKRSIVYVKPSEEAVFELREIIIGTLNNGQYEVYDGLRLGEEIVSNGAFTVDAAAQLQAKPSMMSLKEETIGQQIDLSDGFDANFNPFFDAYFDLKDALVSSNRDLAQGAADRAQNSMQEAVRTQGFDQQSKDYFKGLSEQLAKIKSQTDLEKQRDVFRLVSEEVISLAKGIKDTDANYYVQYCPMANNNKGANWLSTERLIANPYYGDMMLRCGKVTDSIVAEMP